MSSGCTWCPPSGGGASFTTTVQYGTGAAYTVELTLEGPDDMPSHIKMALTRTSESVPFAGGRLLLGTWQGIFLWEHRHAPPARTVVVTVMG
jgi:secondary thiamine-phosphate synthase enzyme